MIPYSWKNSLMMVFVELEHMTALLQMYASFFVEESEIIEESKCGDYLVSRLRQISFSLVFEFYEADTFLCFKYTVASWCITSIVSFEWNVVVYWNEFVISALPVIHYPCTPPVLCPVKTYEDGMFSVFVIRINKSEFIHRRNWEDIIGEINSWQTRRPGEEVLKIFRLSSSLHC